MQIILLSGGSGARLWPLSNDARSKQFLRLLKVEGSDEKESMLQRVMRQIRKAGIDAPVTVATSVSQVDSVVSQLGPDVNIVAEPERRHTFPAICLACQYLSMEKHCPDDEVVVVMPCDTYTEDSYFNCIKEMAEAARRDDLDMVFMGVTPTYPSAKYGYVLPEKEAAENGILKVKRFVEKPDPATAERLIADGAAWNGGVFAFRLGYLNEIARNYIDADSYKAVYDLYGYFPRISFDYEVAEKVKNAAMVEFKGEWKDLGTWNTLTDEIHITAYGNVIMDGTGKNTHVFNELDIPLLCLGTRDLVIAASPDGIIVSEKGKSENVKYFAEDIKIRPMYEERRWGTYKVIDSVEYPDGYCALTKQLRLKPGASISYQKHACRDEVWTFIDGEGEIVLDGVRRKVKRGETVVIPKGMMHTLRATTGLSFIEVQSGHNLVEEDIERFPYKW